MGQVVSFALREVERIARTEPEVMAIGGVLILGLNQLERADQEGSIPFVERWRNAICRWVGSEEFEKFSSSR